jgi:hypothetical protein
VQLANQLPGFVSWCIHVSMSSRLCQHRAEHTGRQAKRNRCNGHAIFDWHPASDLEFR